MDFILFVLLKFLLLTVFFCENETLDKEEILGGLQRRNRFKAKGDGMIALKKEEGIKQYLLRLVGAVSLESTHGEDYTVPEWESLEAALTAKLDNAVKYMLRP